jgi:CRP-like cAMP-binding protein
MSFSSKVDQDIQNRLLTSLTPEELDLLRPHFNKIWLSHSQPLIVPGAPIKNVYFPINSLASLVTIMEDGSTVESGAVGREGMVGIPVLLETGATPMQTVVQIPGEAIEVKSERIRELFDKGGAFYTLMHRYIHTLFVVASQSAACNRLHQIGQRLSRWLLMSSDGIASDKIDLTQEYLATMLGVRRAGVTEAALGLQEEGLILYNRGRIEILNREALEARACECYRVVKGEFDRLHHSR